MKKIVETKALDQKSTVIVPHAQNDRNVKNRIANADFVEPTNVFTIEGTSKN
jgi:hypothetical protein